MYMILFLWSSLLTYISLRSFQFGPLFFTLYHTNERARILILKNSCNLFDLLGKWTKKKTSCSLFYAQISLKNLEWCGVFTIPQTPHRRSLRIKFYEVKRTQQNSNAKEFHTRAQHLSQVSHWDSSYSVTVPTFLLNLILFFVVSR